MKHVTKLTKDAPAMSAVWEWPPALIAAKPGFGVVRCATLQSATTPGRDANGALLTPATLGGWKG